MSDIEPTAAEMVVKLEAQLDRALRQARFADSEGIQNQLDGYRERAATDVLTARIAELEAAVRAVETAYCESEFERMDVLDELFEMVPETGKWLVGGRSRVDAD